MATRIPGIDVARYQGEPDWAAVRGAGYVFTYIKATEGIGYISPTLDAQLSGARGAGMVTGLYHFGRPDTNTPDQDAADFAKQLARLDSSAVGNLAPCLDIETDAADLAGWIKGFIDAVRAHTGRQEVVVYSSTSWFTEKLAPERWQDPAVFLWVAHYGRNPGEPGYLTDKVVMHQHSAEGRVPGIDGNTDLNVSMVELDVLTGKASPPAPQDGETYVVRPGDTLAEIAERLGLPWEEIASFNGIVDPQLIYLGQVLRIPR